MDIQGRILQSLRPRRDGLLLRSDVSNFGSASQVTAAFQALLAKGAIERLALGVYAKPSKVAELGRQKLLAIAAARSESVRKKASKKSKRSVTTTATARHVLKLARSAGVAFSPTWADQWAVAVTRLAGDEVKSDATDDLLVALTRAGQLSPQDMVRLVMAHHRDLRGV